ncbi:alpha/beta hydrolase [Gluconacetobacter diazotrophicus]|uniref:Alpha/beta hydrolase n=2 Tax=Gluconacetobacter diazotrophicus TaxID=33996 RepID=A0A7W4I6N3_GLUDI|nr:alpha/beta hydrolase [Gluconacetobacter diazotrophicus]
MMAPGTPAAVGKRGVMDRRTFVAATAALAGGAFPGCARTQPFRPRHRGAGHDDDRPAPPSGLAIWPGPPPGGGGPTGREHVSASGAVTRVAIPRLTVLRPARPNGAAMLIAAGGGYRRIEVQKEAMPAAGWLASIGVTAFVLTYRLPPEDWAAGSLAPFQDAGRAIRTMRGQAGHLGIDPRRIGVLGFSSGGHLLGMQTACAERLDYAPVDALDRESGRPDLTMLVYPIVTLEPPYQHTSSRRVLIGDHPTPVESARWSVQTHVHSGLAPFFLAQAADDPVSNPQNTAILQAACESAGVRVERHLFPTGGHGFGLGAPGTQTVEWPAMAESWMRRERFV